MLKKNFACDGIVVGVEATNAGDIQWLSEFLEPSFEVAACSADVTVIHEINPLRFGHLLECGPSGDSTEVFILDTQVVSFPLWRVPEVDLAFYDERNEILYLLQQKRIVLLSKTYPRKLRTCLMRTVRELAMAVSHRSGARYLHSAALVLDGRAAIISGPKQAGKTSLLTYILKNTQTDFLANDRLMLRLQDSEAYVKGMPTFVSIRPGTFELFPGLLGSLKNQRFSPRSTLGECADPDAPAPKPWSEGRRGLSPPQYCSLMDCETVAEATGAVMIFPRQTRETGGLSLRKLRPEHVEVLLRECLFEKIHPNRLSEAFSRYPHRLIPGEIISDDVLCRGLSERMPGYECLLGNDAYADTAGAEELLGLLAG